MSSVSRKIVCQLAIGLLALPALVACSTAEKEKGNEAIAPPAPVSTVQKRIRPQPVPHDSGDQTELVDMVGLQTALGLDRSTSDLGYSEKVFNTCQVGYGYSSSQRCRRANFVLIHFRLQCRDSEGSVGLVSASQISPISDQVKWTLGHDSGMTQTDGEGYGQLRVVSEFPSRQQRLRFTVNGKFLIVRAEDAGRLVAPLSWCTH